MLGYDDHFDEAIGRQQSPVRELRSGLPGLGGPPALHPAWCEPRQPNLAEPTRPAAEASFARWLEVRFQADDEVTRGR